jgi:hypothetical protein
VAACYTKNGDPATLPLPRDLADDLGPYVAAISAGSPVFRLVKNKGTKLLRRDLKAAGIEYQDASGLFFDFHSLRCQTATMADAAGVSPRVVQKLMRHSSLELTGRYTRPRAVDIEAAAEKLPSLKPAGDPLETLAATGTDASHANTLAPILIQSGRVSVRDHSLPCAMIQSNVPGTMEGKSPENKAQGASLRVGALPVDPGYLRSRSARNLLGKPIPPDDLGHPELLLRRLRSTAAGCNWLLDRWIELRAALEAEAGWGRDERICAVRLLAKLPADAIDDPTVRTIYLCCFTLGLFWYSRESSLAP